MRTLTSSSLLLLTSALAALPGCDDDFDVALADDGEVSERCVGSGCTVGGLGNTSRIGDHALSNLSKTLGQNALNISSNIKITGGTAYWNGTTQMSVTGIDVEADGELRLQLSTAGWIQGTAVQGAKLDVTVTPTDPNLPAFTGKLWIVEAVCAPGKYDASMTICKYKFLTDVTPSDTVTYPQHTSGWYHTCPNEDEQGTLDGFEKYSSVLSAKSRLAASPGATPSIQPSTDIFINGCINGAVSKGQYFLNAFYDSTAYRGLAASQRSAMLLMWMAWHAGQSRTVPGQTISPHDPIGGLFTWTSDPAWNIEGGYTYSGASCRGTAYTYGVHRYIPDPVLNLVGWSGLATCNATNIGSRAVLGVKVPTDI